MAVRAMRIARTAILAAAQLCQVRQGAQAFQHAHPQIMGRLRGIGAAPRIRVPATSGSGETDDERAGGGEDLARQFYDRLERRRGDAPTPDADELFAIDADSAPRPAKRFTGAPAPSLFAGGRESPSSNLDRERRREFDLAGRFERTFGLQVAVLVISFVGIASVGLSGGITDGSERDFGGDDEVNDVVVERLFRRTDDAAEAEARFLRPQAIPRVEDGAAEEESLQTSKDGRIWL